MPRRLTVPITGSMRPSKACRVRLIATEAETSWQWQSVAASFDRVTHDRLMAPVAARVTDRRLLRLIRSYLTAGVLDNGFFEDSREGTPQGGPLSPLLSNLVLDELDRELKRRGHRFVRYADDCNIYVRSEKAGRRVMESLTRFIERRLKLLISAEKSAVARPWHPGRSDENCLSCSNRHFRAGRGRTDNSFAVMCVWS